MLLESVDKYPSKKKVVFQRACAENELKENNNISDYLLEVNIR